MPTDRFPENVSPSGEKVGILVLVKDASHIKKGWYFKHSTK